MKHIFLVVMLYISSNFQGFSQEDKIQAAAQSFFSAFVTNDQAQLKQEFVSKDAFWQFLTDSYLIGHLNDTLKTQSEQSRLKLQSFWDKDLDMCRKKASEFYKIHWDATLDPQYSIEYQERSNAGFMFQSYRVTIRFTYKKKVYTMNVDGFVVVEGKVYILANECTLTH